MKDWLEWVATTSIPINRLDDKKLPIANASAALINYKNKRFLFSVRHAIRPDSQDWVAEIKYDPEKGTEVYKPNFFNYVAEFSLNTDEIRDVDFCYAEVPIDLNSYYQELNQVGEVLLETPRHVFSIRPGLVPSFDERYAFSGRVFVERIGDDALAGQVIVYPGLKYIRTEDQFHIFELPVDHPGDEHFFGCSGAPIVDCNKNIVALVCNGNKENNLIYGLSIDRYMHLININHLLS